ncbi:glycosyltransferase family 39 protein [Patescibacteria group bacterium]|nr:glycosyltransferase family 39 protein [Patescibacteria group bacterium]
MGKLILKQIKPNWFFLTLVVIYLITRAWGLVSWPLFTDEVYYLRLVREGISNPLWISFADGKEPLFFWLLTALSRLPDPILAGRVMSLLAGLGTATLVYFLGKELFDQRTGQIAMLFYVFSPFALVYNRLSLLDGLLVFLLTGFLFGLVKASRLKSLRWVLISGVFYGLALVTKTIAQMFVFLVPLTMLIIKKNKLLLLVIIIAGAIYLPILFAPGFAAIADKNQTFVYSPFFAAKHIREVLLTNLKMSLKDWLAVYLGVLPLVGVLIAGVYNLVHKNKSAAFLAITFFLPLLAEAFLAKIFFPRYLLILLVPGFLLDAYLIGSLKLGMLRLVILVAFLIQPLILFMQIEVSPATAPLPAVEQWQFFTGWPSGLKAAKQIEAIRILAAGKKIVVATENYGVGEFVRYYFSHDPGVNIRIINPGGAKIEADYVAVNQ